MINFVTLKKFLLLDLNKEINDMANITLTNDIHNTVVNLKHIMRKTTFEKKKAFEVGSTTMHKLKKELCGNKTCNCILNAGQIKYTIKEKHMLETRTFRYFIVINHE